MITPDLNSFELLVPLFLGIVEGLTEYLPVSSTGHLILASRFINLEGPKVSTFEVFIQLGAILAVVFLYPYRFKALFDFKNRDANTFAGWRSLMLMGVASLPALAVGAVLHKTIKSLLFTPLYVALALIVGALLMIFAERRTVAASVNKLEELTVREAFVIGMFQVLSLWPGFSRSGSTITGGLLAGVNRQTAAEFSFLISVPVMCAAVSYDLYKSINLLTGADIVPFTIGFAVSFFTAVLAIRFFISLISKITLIPFAIYRIGLGLVVMILLARGAPWPH